MRALLIRKGKGGYEDGTEEKRGKGTGRDLSDKSQTASYAPASMLSIALEISITLPQPM